MGKCTARKLILKLFLILKQLQCICDITLIYQLCVLLVGTFVSIKISLLYWIYFKQNLLLKMHVQSLRSRHTLGFANFRFQLLDVNLIFYFLTLYIFNYFWFSAVMILLLRAGWRGVGLTFCWKKNRFFILFLKRSRYMLADYVLEFYRPMHTGVSPNGRGWMSWWSKIFIFT